MYRLVLCDMDMTLLGVGEEHVSKAALDAFRSLRNLGVHVGACSGRGLSDLRRQFCGEAWCLDVAVASNGCIVRAEGQTIATHELSRAEVERAVELVSPVEGAFLVVGREGPGAVVGASLEVARAHYDMWRGFNLEESPSVPEVPLLKVNLALPREDPELGAQLVAQLRLACPSIEFCVLGYGGADMMPVGVSKATGLRELMAHLGIADNEVLVFGDSANDVEVMREVPGSVAVANATEQVRELARHHIGPCTEDAVAQALTELALAMHEGREPQWMRPEAEAAALRRALTDETVSAAYVQSLFRRR